MRLVGEARPKAITEAVTAMNDDKAIGLLLDIKGEVGALRGDVGELRGELKSRPCAFHQAELKDLGNRIDAVDTRVDGIQEAVSSLDWWGKTRNKVIVALLAALLGIAGAVAGDWIKDWIKSPIPSVQAGTVQPDSLTESRP